MLPDLILLGAMLIPLLIVLGVLAFFIFIIAIMMINIYNRLVTLRNRFKNGFSQIEVQLKRRYDLIPNLVEVAKGYMGHERDTLEAVIQARNSAHGALETAAQDPSNSQAIQGLAGAEKQLSGSLGRLFALSESYPDLKASANMMSLQEELTSTENKVAFSRQGYNDGVMAYNTYRQTFPPIIFASMFGHPADAPLLEFDSEAIADAPKISF